MKRVFRRTSWRLAVFLASVFLLISPQLEAQGSQGEPASHDTQRIQGSTTNTDTKAGNAQKNSDQSSDALVNPNYILGPEDVINIEVFNVPELSKTVRVANDGMISLPLIGRVQAADLTAEQLRKELADKWGENYLQDPQVTVFVNEFKSKPVSVIGAVAKPGLYPLTGRRTLVEMLSMAGGLGNKMNSPAGRTICVTRKGGFGDLQPTEGLLFETADQIEIDIKRLLYSHDDALNIEIKPSDVISVSKADIIYVVGAVKKPGGFVMEDREHVTVMQAVAMAEGFSGSPSKSAARIIRTNQDGTKTDLPVNVAKIFKGRSPDVVLAANDILYIPDSTQKNAAKKSGEAALALVSGLLIYGRL